MQPFPGSLTFELKFCTLVYTPALETDLTKIHNAAYYRTAG